LIPLPALDAAIAIAALALADAIAEAATAFAVAMAELVAEAIELKPVCIVLSRSVIALVIVRTPVSMLVNEVADAVVGERGPELIDFNNGGQIYTANQTASIIGGEVAGEIRALRDEVSLLRYEARSTAQSSAKIARLQDNWDVRGLTVRTDVDQPLDTVAV